MDFFKNASEEFARNHRDVESTIRRAQAEGRDLTDAEEHANKERFVAMKRINDQERHVMQFASTAINAAMDSGVRTGTVDVPGGTVTFPSDAPGRAEYERSVGINQFSAGGGGGAREQFVQAAATFARTGSTDNRFATITTTSGSPAGLLLPKEVAQPLITGDTNCFRLGLSLVGSAPVYTPGAQDLTIPLLDQNAGSIVPENAAVETENEPATNSIRLTPKMLQSGSAWFSDLAMAALNWDMASAIAPELSHSKELALESAITSAMIADTTTGSVLTATTASVTYLNMLALLRAVPRRFSRQVFIVLGSETFAALERLLDSTGRPLLVQDPQNGELLRFNSMPIVRSDLLEAMGAPNRTVGLAISALGFRLRDCGQPAIARFANIPNRPAQVGFNLFQPHAWGWTPAAVVRLRTPAA